MQRPRRAVLPFLVACGLAAVAAFAALPASADHAQTDGGRIVAFDHRTGNDWWWKSSFPARTRAPLLASRHRHNSWWK